MAFNGSGTFNRIHSWATDKTNLVAVTASRMDTEDDGFATGLTTCIAKDGQTTTTARIPFASGTSAAAGSVSAASYAAASDLDTGLYFPAANEWGLTAGGTQVLAGTATAITVTGTLTPSGALRAADGTVAAPGITFSGDTDSGWYRIGANNVGGAVNGAKVLDIATTGLGVTGTLTSTGAATFTGAVIASSTLAVTGAATLTGAVTASSTLAVTGAATLTGAVTASSTIAVTGAATLSSTLAVTGAATLSSTLAVTGAVTASGDISAATASGAQIATQAQQETGTATNVLVTPGRQHFHPGHPKVWCNLDGTGVAAIRVSFNMTSITDNGTGDFTFTFATAFSGADYVIVGTCRGTAGAAKFNANINQANAPTASTVRMAVADSTNDTQLDPEILSIVGLGDQ